MTYEEQQEIERKAREAAAKAHWQTPKSEDQPWTVKAKVFNDAVAAERKRIGN